MQLCLIVHKGNYYEKKWLTGKKSNKKGSPQRAEEAKVKTLQQAEEEAGTIKAVDDAAANADKEEEEENWWRDWRRGSALEAIQLFMARKFFLSKLL